MTVTITFKELHIFVIGAFVGSLIACHPNIDRGFVAFYLGVAAVLMILIRIIVPDNAK